MDQVVLKRESLLETHFVTAADGTQIAYRLDGEGDTTVVLSNGIGCNDVYFRVLIRELAKKHRVLSWHYRGHMASGVPEDRSHLGFSTLLDDFERVLDAASVTRAVFGGFSMGTQINFDLYSRHPELFDGLVPICGNYEYPLKNFLGNPLVHYLLPLLVPVARRFPNPVQKIWQNATGGPLALPVAKAVILNAAALKEIDFLYYQLHLSNMDASVFLEMALHLARHSARHILATIDVPTLVIAGTDDNFTPVAVVRKMATLIPGARYVEIEGGTHGTLMEFPDEVASHVCGFVDGLYGT
jgi:pimeloyl-ACP methyl ester carboxylesterase